MSRHRRRTSILPFIFFPISLPFLFFMGFIGLILRCFTFSPLGQKPPARENGAFKLFFIIIGLGFAMVVISALLVAPLSPPALTTTALTSDSHLQPSKVIISPPIQAIKPDEVLPAPVTSFTKTWIIYGGKKLDGIFSVRAAPGQRVSIVYSDGGIDIPVGNLPSGFLNLWQITPDKLSRANQ